MNLYRYFNIYLLLTAIVQFGCSCDEESLIDADKSAFLPEKNIRYEHAQNGDITSLTIHPYTCQIDDNYEEMNGGSYYCVKYYGEVCGQSIRKDDHTVHILDHTISSESVWIYLSTKIYFESDQFTAWPFQDSTNYRDSMIIGGSVYYDVKRLTPNFIDEGHLIDSIFYNRKYGVLQIHDVNQHIWSLVE